MAKGSKKTKKPTLAQAPSDEKQARIKGDPQDSCFRWRTNRLDFGGPWGWHLVHPCELHRNIIRDLHELEGWTWMDVQKSRSKGSGNSISVQDLHKDAQARLTQLGIEEENLFELRIDGFLSYQYPRVWGVRDGQYLRVLWWDPYHEIYHTVANKKERRTRNAGVTTRAAPDPTSCPFGATGRPAGDLCKHCSTQLS